MKTKGITIWERHAEKFVLAIAVLVFVALTALQFVGEPNAVSTTAGTLSPGTIDGVLEQRARQLEDKLLDDAPAGVEIPDQIGAADELAAELDQSVSPSPELSQWAIAIAPSVEGGAGGENPEFPVPEFAAPHSVMTAQYFDALADGVVESVPELAELFAADAETHDVVFVTAFAGVNLADLRQQVRRSRQSQDGKPIVIPSSWYNDHPENIVDVVIEREELVNDGWTDRITLHPLPGGYSLRPQISGDLRAGLRDDVLAGLSDEDVQLAIVQPDFYDTRNDNWSVPVEDASEVAAGQTEDDRIGTYRRRIANLTAELDRLMRQLVQAGGTMGGGIGDAGGGGDDDGDGSGGRRSPPGGGKRAPPGGGGGFGTGGEDVGGRRKPGGGDVGGPGRKDPAKIERLMKSIRRVQSQIANAQRQLDALVPKEAAGTDADKAEGEPSVLERDDLLVWGHDIWVTPGHTYRYRFTIKVFNPFFGKKRSLVEQQQHLAEDFALSSASSEWSGPIRVDPPLRVFITNASPAGATGFGGPNLGKATAEVFRFYDGRQWMETFTVEPGESIGAVMNKKVEGRDAPVPINFSTGLFVLDIVEDIDSGAAAPRGGRADLGRRARVLLQNAGTGEILELRDPTIDRGHPDRRRLQEMMAESGA